MPDTNADRHPYSADRDRDPHTVSNASGVLIPHGNAWGDRNYHSHDSTDGDAFTEHAHGDADPGHEHPDDHLGPAYLYGKS
jgi:hypothetical protein